MMSLAARGALLFLILFFEKLTLVLLVGDAAIPKPSGFWGTVFGAQQGAVRFFLVAAISLALLTWARKDSAGWLRQNAAARGQTLRPGWLVLHGFCMLSLLGLSFMLYGQSATPQAINRLVAIRLPCAAAGVLALFLALAPWRIWWQAARSLGISWLYILIIAAVAVGVAPWIQTLWEPTAALTFDLVRRVLVPFIPDLQPDAHLLILRSSRFSLRIANYCSGLEGAGLMLAFCSGWLLYFRREYIFPRALLLVPVGLALAFALNIVRIAVLMLIGYEGLPGVAIYGFHSQAGWISFDCAAAVIAIASQRVGWISRSAAARAVMSSRPAAQRVPRPLPPVGAGIAGNNPSAVYLLPFLAILAAGMLARAMSAGFDTLYVLRPIAATVALVWSWPRLRGLDWRFSWRGLLAGTLVFGVWVAAARLLVAPEHGPTALAAMSAPARILWLATRVGSAVVVVPIAEELAFRGYLLRRVAAADFESVRFREVGILALLISALAFGAEHGKLWLPAAVAGLVYGRLLMRTERFGEVIAAHGVCNALLALLVLRWGQWQLW